MERLVKEDIERMRVAGRLAARVLAEVGRHGTSEDQYGAIKSHST